MIVNVVKEKGDIFSMLNMLVDDLKRPEDLRAVSRAPEPRGGLRYRDMLMRLYRSLGSFQAAVIVERRDGLRRIYVFHVRALATEEARDFEDCPVEASGYIVERMGDEVAYREFRSARLSGAPELYRVIREVADKFRWSDIEIYLKSVEEYEDTFWLV